MDKALCHCVRDFSNDDMFVFAETGSMESTGMLTAFRCRNGLADRTDGLNEEIKIRVLEIGLKVAFYTAHLRPSSPRTTK